MARTYLEAAVTNEQPRVLVMDYAKTIGGTWAYERIYPGLKTNNVAGTYEFSDFPMDLDRYSLKAGQHIPGLTVHHYLSDFAEHFGLKDLIRLETKVLAATMSEDGTWLIDFSDRNAGNLHEQPTARRLKTKKLVLATGLTSEPFMPSLPGQHRFQGNMIHSKQLKEGMDVIKQSRNVVVIGGNKSAWDVCYAAAMAGAQVHMVMRPSGGGPSWVWRPIQIFSFQTSLSRLSLTRLFTWFDPWPFSSSEGVMKKFLNRSTLGRRVRSWFWNILDYYVCRANGYSSNRAVRLMKPWTSTFWMGNSLSIHNYDTNWFQLVKDGRVVPHIAEISSLDRRSVHLTSGIEVEADIVVACTGWKSIPSIDFKVGNLQGQLPSVLGGTQLGISDLGSSSFLKISQSPEEGSFTSSNSTCSDQSIREARNVVIRLCPDLVIKPVRSLPTGLLGESEDADPGPASAPFCLYRFMVPSSDAFLATRNLAFIGAHLSIHAVMLAQVQALWITAFFQGLSPNVQGGAGTMRQEALLQSEYERVRRPKEAGGSGARFPDLVFDSLPYMDMLLEDLAMKTKRKSSWISEIFQPYKLADYRGLISEWHENRKKSIA
ncbi:uncharacterized protein JN550_007118 [Neoarthrinium moseri]|uniref:uncharacterized protein n=1 Tax=Neoarthrinium moseri TaxID=1658444 RepID=UPI001FDBB9DF|nr:uncharacterized protein JN550_007118 [Neoarthrinium moseri]KAI1867387.1 hypothetical protein JN550_007118 [Neoarthrinium moseri]